MRKLGIDHLTVAAMPPLQLVDLAVEAGVDSISLNPLRMDHNPFGFPDWSLAGDAKLRRELKARLADTGMVLALGDPLPIQPGVDVASLQPQVDAYGELGAVAVNVVSFEPDRERNFEQFCRCLEMIRAAGMQTVCEFFTGGAYRWLDDVADLIKRLGAPPDVGMLVDVMHFYRARHQTDDIKRFDPKLIRYIQFCDAPMRGEKQYYFEGVSQRDIPGEGEMPVRELMSLLPRDCVVSIEVPHQRMADAGMGHLERVKRIAAASRAMLADIEAG